MRDPIPSHCKAMVAERTGADLVLKDVPVPRPAAGEVLVKTLACGVCHSDEVVRQGLFGDLFPRILGHEMIGDIVAVGPGESRWQVGERVGGGWHGGHDATCKQCGRGKYQLCDNAAVNGVSRDGGYAEYCTLRSEAVVQVPRELDPAATAPLLCAGVTLMNSVRNMHIPPGETVAVQGLGGLGHLGIQYVRKMGYETVALSSSNAKEDLARKLGANHYVDASKQDPGDTLKKMGGAALIVVTAPNPQTMPGLLDGLAAGGKLLVLAPVGRVEFDTLGMVARGLSVHGWNSGHALDSEETVRFAGCQGVECMVERVPLAEANRALERVRTGEVRFRSVLTF